MSEYTDYLIYQPTGATLAAARAEVSALVGRSVIVPAQGDSYFFVEDGVAPLADAEAKWAARTGPKAIAVLVPDYDLRPIPKPQLSRVHVLEDFASWMLSTTCSDQKMRFVFGDAADGYAKGWYGANFGFGPAVFQPPNARQLDALSSCYRVSATTLKGLLEYGKVWTFLETLGAPSEQMMDSSVVVFWDDIPAENVAQFIWDIEMDF